jgi:serine/threonine protein kinase
MLSSGLVTQAQNGVPERLGPYDVGAKIGGGGMAAIYVGRRASGEPEGEIVALKLIRDELARDEQYVHMFLDEARVLSRMSHPSIIVTRDFGVEDGTRFIAMELLLGRSMMDAFERARSRGERMPLDLAAEVARQVAEALDYAHALKGEDDAPLHVIHRDVNPTNVFLTYAGGTKLIDFGLAKSSSRLAKSGEGVVKGKVPYLSPEQIDEKPFDHRADVYALGATLWEMTAGRRLFKRANDVETIRAIREHDVPDPRTFVDGLYPDALWDIVRRALAPEPAGRYETAGAMARDLEAFLEKHGRKGDATERLAAWIDELFPGERAKQEAWLAEVSAVSRPAPKTMAPPAPLAGAAPSEAEDAAPLETKRDSEPPAPGEPSKPPERHPFAALLALAATFGFLVVLALIFSRC